MRAVHFVLRSFSISLVFTFTLLLYGLGRTRTLFIRDAEARRAAVGRLRGRRLYGAMTLLGATFIKLGQVMSTRPDLFSPEMTEELRRLQDELPAFPYRKVERTLKAELGQPIEAVFSELDVEAVAAASVAQVHRGVLVETGEEVAVKVLRPNVRRTIIRDAAILKFWGKVAALHPTVRMSDPVGHLEHFIEGILEQTDLTIEVANYRRFHDNFVDFEGVRFPHVHGDLSTSQVLVMEFIRGVKLDRLPEGDYDDLGLNLARMFFKMCFEDGFLHADMHPGNSMLTDAGEVVLFDVGMAKRLEGEALDQFIDFNRCLAYGSGADFVQHMKTFHHYLEGVDWEALQVDCERLIGQFRTLNNDELEIGEMLNEIFALGRRYDVRPVTEMTLIMVGMVTAEGVGKMLNPDVNSFEIMGEVLMPLIQQRMMAEAAAS